MQNGWNNLKNLSQMQPLQGSFQHVVQIASMFSSKADVIGIYILISEKVTLWIF